MPFKFINYSSLIRVTYDIQFKMLVSDGFFFVYVNYNFISDVRILSIDLYICIYVEKNTLFRMLYTQINKQLGLGNIATNVCYYNIFSLCYAKRCTFLLLLLCRIYEAMKYYYFLLHL